MRTKNWAMRTILRMFVQDVEAAHGAGAADLKAEWPDLHVTYTMAVAALARPAPKPKAMEVGTVPSSWLGIAQTWDAKTLLALRAEVDKRGIALDDAVAVSQVWQELKA